MIKVVLVEECIADFQTYLDDETYLCLEVLGMVMVGLAVCYLFSLL